MGFRDTAGTQKVVRAIQSEQLIVAASCNVRGAVQVPVNTGNRARVIACLAVGTAEHTGPSRLVKFLTAGVAHLRRPKLVDKDNRTLEGEHLEEVFARTRALAAMRELAVTKEHDTSFPFKLAP